MPVTATVPASPTAPNAQEAKVLVRLMALHAEGVFSDDEVMRLSGMDLTQLASLLGNSQFVKLMDRERAKLTHTKHLAKHFARKATSEFARQLPDLMKDEDIGDAMRLKYAEFAAKLASEDTVDEGVSLADRPNARGEGGGFRLVMHIGDQEIVLDTAHNASQREPKVPDEPITIEGETEYADLASSLPSIEEELELEGATHEEAEAAIRTLDAAVGAFFVDNDDLAYEPEQD